MSGSGRLDSSGDVRVQKAYQEDGQAMGWMLYNSSRRLSSHSNSNGFVERWVTSQPPKAVENLPAALHAEQGN